MTRTAGSINLCVHGSAEMAQDKHELVKNAADIVSVFATIGSFLQVITPLFGLIGAVWTLMRIAEMVSGKQFHELISRKKEEANVNE
jgi:hypothetical protein